MALRRPPALTPARTLYTAQDIARFCEVDLKTVHAWGARGIIAHERTPGRHRRFRRTDVLRLLRAHDYPIPAPLTATRPRLAVIAEPARGKTELEAKLRGRFELVLNREPIGGLIELADANADALLVYLDGPVAAPRAVERLRALPSTRHLYIACVGPPAEHEAAKAAGADTCSGARDASGALDAMAGFFGAK